MPKYGETNSYLNTKDNQLSKSVELLEIDYSQSAIKDTSILERKEERINDLVLLKWLKLVTPPESDGT